MSGVLKRRDAECVEELHNEIGQFHLEGVAGFAIGDVEERRRERRGRRVREVEERMDGLCREVFDCARS